MSYGDNDENERIELLLRLQTAELERRVVVDVLASLTDKERDILKQRITDAIVKKAETFATYELQDGGQIQTLTRAWIANAATTFANKEWADKWHPRIVAATATALADAFNEKNLTASVAATVDALKAPAIKGIVESAVRHLRAWKP